MWRDRNIKITLVCDDKYCAVKNSIPCRFLDIAALKTETMEYIPYCDLFEEWLDKEQYKELPTPVRCADCLEAENIQTSD